MNTKKKKILVTAGLLVLFVVASVGALLFWSRTQEVPRPHKDEAPISMFEFAGIEGWMQGPSNSTSMALFNSHALSEEAPCFTSTEYYDGTVDMPAQLKKSQQDMAAGGYVVTALGVKTLTIQTQSGARQYDMHLSRVTTTAGSGKIMGGHAIGYVQLRSGYLKIYGNCNTAEELPRVFPALEAISIRM